MKLVVKLLLWTAPVILFVLYSPTLLEFDPVSYSPKFLPLRGPLEINDKLSKAEHLFEGLISGPESIVFHKGALYTGVEDGRILKIVGNTITEVAKIGADSCILPYEEKLCGRPLGLRVGKDEQLYIIDAYFGLNRMDFSNGQVTRLFSNSLMVGNKKLTFPDDMDIDDEGNVYFSDASSRWDLSNIYYLITEHRSTGRIIRYNIHNGEAEVLMDDLNFPNGVQISHDGKSLLVCEIGTRRILRYFLKGSKKGQTEVMIDRLPAEPDNIRLSSRGGYWVALTTARNDTHPILLDDLAPRPMVRRFWARLQHAVGSLLTVAADLMNCHVFKDIAYRVKRGDIILGLFSRHGIMIEVDDNGNIIGNYQSPDGSTSELSQVTEHDGYLYLGSFRNHYIGKLKL